MTRFCRINKKQQNFRRSHRRNSEFSMKNGIANAEGPKNMKLGWYGLVRFCSYCRAAIWLSLLFVSAISVLTVQVARSPDRIYLASLTDVNPGYGKEDLKRAEICDTPVTESGIPLTERIKRRAECRFTKPIPKKLVPDARDNEKNIEYYLTHDLENAVGLGNFMFISASLMALAFLSNRIALLPQTPNRKHHLKFENPFPIWEAINGNIPFKASEVLKQHKLTDSAAGIYNETYLTVLSWRNSSRISSPKPIIALHGYLQSWKYFHHIQELIRWQMTFVQSTYQRAVTEIDFKLATYTRKTGIKPKTIVGIHVRRGDLLDPVMRQYGHTVAPKTYLTKVTRKVNATYPNTVFALVSNDLKFCQEVFSGATNVLYMDENAAEVDMAILTLMDHLILTVGTFGWWGAYLSDAKDVYYYKHWPRNRTKMANEYIAKDFFLPHWIPVA